MSNYNRGEKIFFAIVDFVSALAMFVAMAYISKFKLLFLVIGIVSILKGIYNVMALKKM